jgi:hypothetical protein
MMTVNSVPAGTVTLGGAAGAGGGAFTAAGAGAAAGELEAALGTGAAVLGWFGVAVALASEGWFDAQPTNVTAIVTIAAVIRKKLIVLLLITTAIFGRTSKTSKPPEILLSMHERCHL